MARGDWIVAGPAPYVGSCRRCGEVLQLALPMGFNTVIGALRGFEKDHLTCRAGREPSPFAKPGVIATAEASTPRLDGATASA